MRHSTWSPVALIVTFALLPCASMLAQEPPPQEHPAVSPANPEAATPFEAEPQRERANIKFAFQGATYQQVIDFFSRATGLPVIWETPAPEGTLDYISNRSYDMNEAMRVLNIILQARGVMLRVNKDMLYLQKLDQMQKEDVPTYIGQIPETVTDEQITTVVRPLKIALAKPLAEKLATMVAAYGSVTAMEQQNALVITETAANVRRILSIVEQLDMADPEGAVEIFPVKHAKAKDLMPSLTALMGQKIEKYVINQQGQQVKIEEQQMPGLSISADDRTNSIIAKGVQSKIENLRETIKLLDVPSSGAWGAARTVTTMALQQITPSEAAAKLNQLYARIEEKARPTVVPLDDVSKIMILGEDQAVSEGSMLLQELENGAVGSTNDQPQVTLVSLENANAQAVIAAASGLLHKRQQAALKLVPGPDGKSIVISGRASDVEAVKSLIPMLDRQAAPDRQVRLVRLAHAVGEQAQAMIAQAQELFEKQKTQGTHDAQMELNVELDAEAGVVTLIGPARALDVFTNTLRQLESNIIVERETRRIGLDNVTPSAIVGPLTAMANQALQRPDGRVFTPPALAPFDQLQMLMVTATPEQMATLESLVSSLDVAGPDRGVRVLTLANADAGQLAANLDAMFSEPALAQKPGWQRPAIRVDAQSNSLIVRAGDDQLSVIQEVVATLDKAALASTRQIRMIPIDPARAKADDIARALEQMINPAGAAGDSGRGVNVKIMTLEELLNRKNQIEATPAPPAKSSSQAPAPRSPRIAIRGLHDVIACLAIASFQGNNNSDSDITIAVDPATNSLIVIGSQRAVDRINALAAQILQQLPASPASIRYITLPENVDVPGLSQLLGQVFEKMPATGPSGPIRQRVGLVPDPTGNALIVAANDVDFEIVADLIAALSKPASTEFPIRTIILQRAQASAVATAIQQFFDDRAKIAAATTGRRETGRGRRVSVMGVESSNTLLIAANDADFEEVKHIAEQFDTGEAAAGLTFRVFQLHHARATEIERTVQSLVNDLIWNQGDQVFFWSPWMPRQQQQKKDSIAVRADARLNTLIVTGRGDKFDVVQEMIEVLDAPAREAEQKVVKLYRVKRMPVAMAADVIRETFNAGRQRRFWETPDPTEIKVRADEAANVVIVSASNKEHAEIKALIEGLDSELAASGGGAGAAEQTIHVLPVQFARASEISQTLKQFLTDRAKAVNAPRPAATIVPSDAANTLVVSAPDAELALIRELLGQLDQSEIAGAPGSQRAIEIMALKEGDPDEIARIVREQFGRRAVAGWAPGGPAAVVITPDRRTRSIIVNAPQAEMAQAKTLIEKLDELAPAAAQTILIIDLQNVSPDAAKSIIENIGLHQQQPAGSRSRIVTEPVKISTLPGRNALIVIASPADRENIIGLLKAIDAEPPAELAEAHTQIFRLKNAQAGALSQILAQVLRPADQQAETPLARAVREQVRRLAVRDASAPDKTSQLDLTKPVRLVADQTTNSLIVSSTQQNLAAVEQLIAMFDQLPITEAVTVQLYPLQNIAAEQFARILRDLFAQGKQLGRVALTNINGIPDGAVGKALVGQIAISTDDRTNTVVVAGTEDALALVEVLSQRIDSGVQVGWVEPKIIPLRYADATDLAATLQAILVEGSTNLPQSTPLQRQIGRLRMARMKPNGDPANVLEADVFVPMTRLVVRPEPQMNALILVGTPDNIEVVGELVAMLDVETASPSNAVRIYPVENASAARLAQTIKQLFDQQVANRVIRAEDRVILNADERTNSLLVVTSPRSFAVLENLLKSLDSELAPELREIRTIEVKNASAVRLANLIQQLMDARMERLRRTQPEAAELERAVIVADARINSLIVSAGNDAFEVVKRLAADLDQSTLGDAALVHVLPVEKGNIERIAQAINQIMERRYADLPGDVRRSQRPLILTDSRTNSLLVTASPEDLASIQDLVTKLSGAPENPAVGVHVVALPQGARAEQLAPRLNRLMADRAQSLGAASTPTDRVSVEADLASNSLIVAANEENLQIIRGLIDALTQTDPSAPAEPGREVEVVMLTARNRAADVVELLEQLYVNEANRTRGQNTVRVTADERLNAILINAPASDVRALKDLIAQLDQARPASVVEIKYIPLTSANALETVSLIENVLAGRGIGPRRTSRQATVLKYLREIAKEVDPESAKGAVADEVEMEVSAAIRESITLTPDLRTNTIIVSAPRESIKMIEQMIRDLDSSTTGAKNIRIFKLTNADAEAMAEILTALFNLRQGSSMYVLKPREDGMPTALAPGGIPTAPPSEAHGLQSLGFGNTELTAVPDERQQLSITVDSRTNSLIVSGTPTYLDLVSQVVEELDRLEANEREVLVYPLRNAVADEVARVIGQFVDQEQRKLVGTLNPDQLGSAARLLEREITIAGDKQSNTVLVSASPRYMDRVKDMIQQLDVDPPQVLIQVMLAEVTLDSRDEWGVDLAASFGVNGTTVSGGFGLASAFVNGLGVPNLAIASSDFELLIRAMKSQGRLQVLSNPSIMAANNAAARIQVGETIRLPVSTSITDAGRIDSSLEKEDIGVILEVTPSINPDGFVRMSINPEISNLSARTTQISAEFESPIITRRTADTTVTVHDGQTIVIGGLISDRFERRDRMVPFFGELPLVGALFRSELEEVAKTELLIVLTPHVIESPSNFARVDYITEREIDRLSVPEAVKENIRRSLLDGSGRLYNSKGDPIDVRSDDEDGKAGAKP